MLKKKTEHLGWNELKKNDLRRLTTVLLMVREAAIVKTESREEVEGILDEAKLRKHQHVIRTQSESIGRNLIKMTDR